jgi:Uma2 family endonuclease
MAATVKLKPISVQDYLACEEISEVKHEFVDGYVLAMVGASQRHNLIAGSLFSLLRTHLRGTPCRVFMSDL